MNNWCNTLNESLGDKLINLWPLGTNISYDQTVQVIVEDGKHHRLISVTRDNRGLYERAISYLTD